MELFRLENPEQKSQLCNRILRALPAWFGLEYAIVRYVDDVRSQEMWVAKVDGQDVGFVTINPHFESSAEIHVMGVLESFHRQKIGEALIRKVEESLRLQGFKYLQVKTLSPSREDANYAKTRKFYLKMGFVPLEEFKTLWDEFNPCLQMVKAIG